jgi:multiple sugar transport system substrate-binding protein
MTAFKYSVFATAVLATATTATSAHAWSLEEAAEPYEGTTITVVGLERPSYKAAQELTPQFEKRTGINVEWVSFPYESSLKAQTLNFVSNSQQFDLILTDVVWPVTFAESGWVQPLTHFTNDEDLVDPELDLDDFVDIWRAAFTIDGKLYGLPFDSYSGLLYYNKKLLKEAGFDGPPETWQELKDVYGPKLTDRDKGQYAFALQSAKGETQTADSFTRMLWPFGARYFDADAEKMTLTSDAARKGIQYREDLADYMPDGIVSDNHSQVVQAMGQGKIAMITEWSAFYTTLKDSKIGDDLGIAMEPKGPDGRYAAFGGFAYMISSQVPEERQDAGWLFAQWLTSKEMARPLIREGAVVAREGANSDPEIQEAYPYLEPMLETWKTSSVPDWRPQLRCYPKFSELVSDWGTRIQMGDVSVEEGLEGMNQRLGRYMDQSNCWDTVNQPRTYMDSE